MASPRYICITGPDGCGKSTLVSGVMEKIKTETKLKAELISIWDMLLYSPEFQAVIGFTSKEELDRYLEILDPVSRSLFLFHVFNQSMELAKKKEADIFIIDSYWYKYFATEIAHGADKDVIFPITSIFPEPEFTCFISVSPELAFSRKDKCSGYEIGYAPSHTKEAFIAFQNPAYEIFQELCDRKDWIKLNGTDSPDSLVNQLFSLITKEKNLAYTG